MDSDLDFYAALAAEPYEHRGILHSEAAAIITACRAAKIDLVIESGRARAQSTYMLAKYLPRTLIASVEARPNDPESVYGTERIKPFGNVQTFAGDGKQLVPRLIGAAPHKRIAVLLDGPKGLAALDLLDTCFRRSEKVKLGFIHDMRKLDHGRPSPFRLAAQAIYPDATFTDDPDDVARFRWMDDKILAAGGPVGPAHELQFGSYGPTVGVFMNPLASSQAIATSTSAGA